MPWNSNVSDSLQTILTSCPQFQLTTQVWFSINPQCKLHLHAEIVVMTSRILGIQRSLLPAWHGKYHYSLTGPSKFLIPGSFTASTDCEFQDFCYCWWDGSGGPNDGVFAFLKTDVTLMHRLCFRTETAAWRPCTDHFSALFIFSCCRQLTALSDHNEPVGRIGLHIIFSQEQDRTVIGQNIPC